MSAETPRSTHSKGMYGDLTPADIKARGRNSELGVAFLAPVVMKMGGAVVSNFPAIFKFGLVPLAVVGAAFANNSPAPITAEMGDGSIPDKVDFQKFTEKTELCVAEAELAVSGSEKITAKPFGMDLDFRQYVDKNVPALFRSAVPNLNFEREVAITGAKRIVKYCYEPDTFKVAINQNATLARNLPGGENDPNFKPSIVVTLDETDADGKSTLHQYVSANRKEGIDDYKWTRDGELAVWGSNIKSLLEDQRVKDILGKDNVEGANVFEQVDNTLLDALNSKIDRLAATACMNAGKEHGWKQPIVKTLIYGALKKSIKEQYRQWYPNNLQPDDADILITIADLEFDTKDQGIINAGDQKKQEVLDEFDSKKYDLTFTIPGLPEFKLPITFAVPNKATRSDDDAKNAASQTCTINPAVEAQALSSADKGVK